MEEETSFPFPFALATKATQTYGGMKSDLREGKGGQEEGGKKGARKEGMIADREY